MQSYDFLFSTFLLDYVLLASRLSTHLISVCKLLFWNNFLNIVSNVLEKTHSAKIRLEDVLMESLKNVLKSLGSPSMVPYVTPRNESAVGRPKTYSIIIHKMGFYDFFFLFSWFQLYIRHSTSKISQKPDTCYIGSIIVRDVLTKIGPLGGVLRTSCTGWKASSNNSEFGQNIVSLCDNFKQTYGGFTPQIHTMNYINCLSIHT